MIGNAVSASAKQPSSLPRRAFLAGATATAAAGLAVVAPQSVRGSAANSKVAFGLVGCGGRGRWIADLFVKNGGYQIVATADYFADRAKGAGDQFKVDAKRRYSGLSGYKRLLDSKPDAIVVESTPYFHPAHAMAGVDAGCHVYVAKPIAVDVPGCLTIAEAGRKATEKKLVFLVDFQTRANDFYREAVRRVHAGAIGPISSGEAVYYCGTTWGGDEGLKRDPKNPENRLRAWGLDRVLSGDIITEQNIHALDVATWIVDGHPLKAVGACNRRGRVDNGTCHGAFAVVFAFPNDVIVSFASKQYGTGYDDIGCRMFGPKGTIDTHYGGIVVIRGLGGGSYKGGNTGNIYTDGAVRNIADFHAAILKKDFANATVAPSVRSNLTTILGRTAAYKRTEVTWDEMMRAGEKLEFDTRGLKA
jgi:myo-inositol 2-dehydrogenase/D-chiro-inositol 1-dehydrogenase